MSNFRRVEVINLTNYKKKTDVPTYIPFQKFGETLIDLPLNVDRSNLTKYLVFPGLHAPHMLLDHDRRRDAALILVSKRPRPVPTLDQHHLIQFEQRKMQ